MRVYLLQYHKARAKLVVVLSDHTIIHEKLKNTHTHTLNERQNVNRSCTFLHGSVHLDTKLQSISQRDTSMTVAELIKKINFHKRPSALNSILFRNP